MAIRLKYTASGWRRDSFRYYGDLYYLLLLSLLSFYALATNFTRLLPAFLTTAIISLVSYLVYTRKNGDTYKTGFFSSYFLFFCITPFAFLSDLKSVFLGNVVFVVWILAVEKIKLRIFPQGLILYLFVSFFGFLFLHPDTLLTSAPPVFIEMPDSDLSGFTFVQFFYRHRDFYLLSTYSILEGMGKLVFLLLPVMLLRRLEFIVSFVLVFLAFGAAFELNILSFAMLWLVIYFQPGKKIFEHPYVSVISSFIVLLVSFLPVYSKIPPLFFLVLYFLIEQMGLVLFSKYRRRLL